MNEGENHLVAPGRFQQVGRAGGVISKGKEPVLAPKDRRDHVLCVFVRWAQSVIGIFWHISLRVGLFVAPRHIST